MKGSNNALAFYRPPGETPIILQGDVHSLPLHACLSTPLHPGEAAYLLSPYDPLQPSLWLKGTPLKHWPPSEELPSLTPSPLPDDYTNTLPSDFLHQVAHIQDSIQKGLYQKSVAFQTQIIPVGTLHLPSFLHTLCTDYPNAYISALVNQHHAFVCASPELLIRSDGLQAETVALAGTTLWENRHELGEKEHTEQGFIVQHMTECLHSLGLPFDMGQQQIIQSGHLAHLCNTFSFTLPTAQRLDWLNMVHPTPAVCGYPSRQVYHHMQQTEKPRRFYSGFSGILQPEKMSLCVNIRCADIIGDHALLYAGAGITSDSIPEAEWQETQQKLNTLKKYWPA
jgi:isochorismate synthase